MQIAARPRFAAGIASLGVLMVVALSLPGVASAGVVTCRGHTEAVAASEDFENPLEYTFGCTGRIVGFMIVSSQEINGFDTELEVLDGAKAVVGADGFACEGDIPGNGVGCLGSYTSNNVVKGVFDVSERPACTEPRVRAQLVVVEETIDPITGVPKKSSLGSMAGPFDLGRPQRCPRSSILGGLFAEIALRKLR